MEPVFLLSDELEYELRLRKIKVVENKRVNCATLGRAMKEEQLGRLDPIVYSTKLFESKSELLEEMKK
jgi:hypothetical protein